MPDHEPTIPAASHVESTTEPHHHSLDNTNTPVTVQGFAAKISRFSDYAPELRRRLVGMTVGMLLSVQPVAAQSSAVCGADKLPGMIEGFFQLSIGLGLVGLAVVWQADSLIEMFTLNPEQKKSLKHHKRSALKSGVILIALGPLYTLAGTTMGLPLADCIDLVPW